MSSAEPKLCKILFRMHSDILDEITSETLWTKLIDEEKGIYERANLPFYFKNLTIGDKIIARFDEEENFLSYCETIEFSNSSTIHIVILSDSLTKENLITMLNSLDCYFESINEKYFAVEIDENQNWNIIRNEFQKLEEMKEISFSESCLSELHKNQVK